MNNPTDEVKIKSSIKWDIPVKIFCMKMVNLKEEIPMPYSDTVFSYPNKWIHERHSCISHSPHHFFTLRVAEMITVNLSSDNHHEID